MNGKIIKLNDYKLTYGEGTILLKVFSAFKYKGNKYVIYSYDDTKLYWGSLFVRNDEIVVMTSKEDNEEIIKDYVFSLLEDKKDDKYEIVSLDDINSIQIIDEHLCSFKVNILQLEDLTIPKKEVIVEESNNKNGVSYMAIFFIIFLLVLGAFFFFNPEVLFGKNSIYVCKKSYIHDKLPASVNEEVKLVFDDKENIISIDSKSDFVFTDIEYYGNFKDNSYFYQYFKDGDTYKFDDDEYTYRLFNSIDVKNDYFGETKQNELLNQYQKNGYKCEISNEE